MILKILAILAVLFFVYLIFFKKGREKEVGEKPKVKKKIEKKEEAITTDDELNKDELEEAFAQIEKLGLDETNISEVDIKIEDATDIEKQALKEFWE